MLGEEKFLYKGTDLLSIEMVLVNNGITKTAFASAREMVVTTKTSNVTCYLLTWKRLKKVVFMKDLYRNALFMKVLPPLKTIDGLRGLRNVKELETCMEDREIWRRYSSRCPGIDRK